MQFGGLRMGTHIVDADALAHRQFAQPACRVGVDAGVDERGQVTVGRTDAQRPVPSVGQLHRRANDTMQGHIEVQVGTDLDDDAHQVSHLIASGHQLVESFVRLAHRLALPAAGIVDHRHKCSRSGSGRTPTLRVRAAPLRSLAAEQALLLFNEFLIGQHPTVAQTPKFAQQVGDFVEVGDARP